MSAHVYRYRFAGKVRMLEVEETFFLSTFAAEGLYGEARVRLDTGYSMSRQKRCLVIDGSTVVGRAICRIFTALAIKEFGADSFKVERIPRRPEKETAGKEASCEA